MSKILKHIQHLSENENITITKLEQKIGASKGVLSRAIAKNTDIQSKWILKIVENYPQYNAEWLLTGKEPMLKNEDIYYNKTVGESEINYKDLAESRKETIESLKKQITYLEEKIAFYAIQK